jgi:hypothetical protein
MWICPEAGRPEGTPAIVGASEEMVRIGISETFRAGRSISVGESSSGEALDLGSNEGLMPDDELSPGSGARTPALWFLVPWLLASLPASL